MTPLYLLLWLLIAGRELPELWRAKDRCAVVIWLLTALAGLGMWAVVRLSAWRLAEWLLWLR